jgi:hypothetical protein
MDIKMKEIVDIKEKIENMNKYHQIEVLRILKEENNYKIILNQNNNGVFVNLTELNDIILNKLKIYIEYVEKQTNNIESIELKKELIENTFFKYKKEQ